MIYLIMVFSAIMLPSCTTMDSSSHLSLDTSLNVNTSSSRRPTDDSDGRVVAPLSLSLKTQQLGPDDLVLSSVTPKGNLGHSLSNGLSSLYVKHVPLSKSFRRRRRYQEDQGQDVATTRIRQPLERAMARPLSLKLYHKLLRKLQLAQRAVLKKKRTSFRNHARNYDSTSKIAPGIISKDKRGTVSIVTDNKFSNGNNVNKVHKRGELDNENNPLKLASILGDNSHIKNVPVSKRTTLVTHASSGKVKRSTSSERTSLEDDSEIYVAGDNNTNPNVSIRNSTRSDEDNTNLNIGSSKVSNASSSKNNVTTARRGKRRRRGRRRHRQSKDLALWIDERQVKLFSGYMMEIYAIHDGRVLPYILDPNFEKHLPVIPFEVQSVNFTWQAGRKRYYYTFDRLFSQDESILKNPVVSLPTQGRVPRKPKVFTVNIHCTGNASGIASFDIGLLIQTRRGKPMPGTPLRIKLRKECTQPSPDPECDEKCENGGVCDAGSRCQCPEGYMGQYCNTALCYPQCMNGGFCNTPGRCTCPPGYQGRHCEGGICRDKCENGGKCIQKDTCACSRGYYGNRCEFSKCVIPCINGGRCRNVNKCRCPHGFSGDHCEIVTGRNLAATALSRCSRKCRHGSCRGMTCHCQQGFTGRWCRRRGSKRKRVWL